MVMLEQRTGLEILYGLHTIRHAKDWSEGIGLQYVFNATTDWYGATTEGNDLDKYGWIITGAPPYIVGSLADFATADDKGTTGGVHLDTASDVVQSPQVFGDFNHMAAICHLLGRISGDGTPDLPRYLEAVFSMRFSATAAEIGTGVGFVEAGGSAAVAADHMAAIASDGTNIVLRSGAATSATILADTLNPFIAKIKVDRINALAYGWINDFSGAGKSIAIEADLWPACFGAGVVAAGTNDPVLAWAIVRYGW